MERFVENTRSFVWLVKQEAKAQVRGAGGRYVSAGASAGKPTEPPLIKGKAMSLEEFAHSQLVKDVASGKVSTDITEWVPGERQTQPVDHLLAALYKMQGYDALPHVVDEETFKTHIANGETDLYRGISGAHAEQYAEQLRSGPYFAGKGIAANGTYGSHGRKAKDEAGGYAHTRAKQGAVLAMSIRKEANMVSSWDHQQKMRQTLTTIERKMAQLSRADDKTMFYRYQAMLRILSEPGRMGVFLGYDGVEVAKFPGHFCMWNRSALRIVR